MTSLETRRILVTGGSHGIGLEVSRELARRGGRVVVAARETEAIDAAIDGFEGSGHEGISIDVSDPETWEDAAVRIDAGGELRRARDRRGNPRPDRFARGPRTADLIETIAVNLVGTMLALRFALPRLRAGGGRAVTFSGGGGTSPLPRYDAYAASKAAVVRLTREPGRGRRDRDQRGRARVRRDANARRDAPSRSRGRRSELLRAHARATAQGGFPPKRPPSWWRSCCPIKAAGSPVG